jgi:hypothetical protein
MCVYSWSKQETTRSYGAMVLATVCIVLLFLGAGIQAGHAHRDGQTHNTCSLCLTAHSALSIVALPALILFLESFTSAVAVYARADRGFSLPYALFTRPPPDRSLLPEQD